MLSLQSAGASRASSSAGMPCRRIHCSNLSSHSSLRNVRHGGRHRHRLAAGVHAANLSTPSFDFMVVDKMMRLIEYDSDGPVKKRDAAGNIMQLTTASVLPMSLIKPVWSDRAWWAQGLQPCDGSFMDEEEKAGATWGVRAVGATRTRLSGAGVKVAVLDTGLDRDYRNHPAFEGIKHDTVVCKNFTTDNEADTHDTDGHGTHCLGTILGRPVDSINHHSVCIGVAPGVTDVLVAKVIPDGDRLGTSDMLVGALLWAWWQGANIINVSLAFDLESEADRLLLQGIPRRQAANIAQQTLVDNLRCLERMMGLLQGGDAIRPPPLVIAACGNDSSATSKMSVCLPAAAPGILSVAAAAKSPEGIKVAAFSNVGARICAPGVGVSSAAPFRPNTFGTPLAHFCRVLSGTSMAAPHAAGVAALWWEKARLDGFEEKIIAEVVAEKLGAFATRKGFALDVDAAAMGRGLVQAPPEYTPDWIAG